jgi:universal stress protein E
VVLQLDLGSFVRTRIRCIECHVVRDWRAPISARKMMSAQPFSRILVAIADPSVRVNKAVRRATALARTTGARLDLFNAIPMSVSAGTAHAVAEHFTRLEVEKNQRLLERAANRLRREEIVVDTHVQTGYPVHEAILRQIRLTNPDLLVIEARKHNMLARLLLTQTDFELIRYCPIPLLIVKGKVAWRSPRILAALDPFHRNDRPSSLDREIVQAARTMAAATRGSVHFAHVCRPLASFALDVGKAPVTPRALVTQERAYERSARSAFSEFSSEQDIPKTRAHFICGDPIKELPAFTRSMRAGLLVMGAVSRSRLKRIFIGNTAERMLDSVRCDVLVAKAHA